MQDERTGEDLLTTLLGSLETLVSKALRINRWLIYTIYILIFWIAFSLILWGLSIIRLDVKDIALYAVLVSLALIILFALVDIRENLAEVISRYSAYKYMEKLPLEIPPGKDPVERLIKYFNETLNFENELKKRGGQIIQGEILCGKKVHFDYYAEIKRQPLDTLRGRKSYSLFVRWMENVNLDKLREFVEDVRRCAESRGVEISRAIILSRGELSDEVYEYLTKQRASIPLQVILEMDDGTYDFIPFIAPRHDMLP